MPRHNPAASGGTVVLDAPPAAPAASPTPASPNLTPKASAPAQNASGGSPLRKVSFGKIAKKDYTTNTTFVAGGLEGNGFASFGSLDNNTQYIPIPLLISTNFPSRTIVLSFQSTPRQISGISDCTVTIINNYSVYSAVILSGTNYVSAGEIYRGQSPNSATIRIVRGDVHIW